MRHSEKGEAMEQLDDLLRPLEPAHRDALLWFHNQRDHEVAWADIVAQGERSGRRLVTVAKGIYKPLGWAYALSVRQVLTGQYPDREPVFRTDGTWLYRYFQENPDPSQRDAEFTNRGLMACMHDRVPVAVLLQVASAPAARYRVLGVALVASWDAGYFFLEGFAASGSAHTPGLGTERETLLAEVTREVAVEDELFAQEATEGNDLDARRRVLAAIVRRQGQGAFRAALLTAYERRCAVTGCDVEAALEAAHILPYRGPHSNEVTNGILLRADIHTLFDLGYLTIDTASMTIRLATQLTATVYGSFDGIPLRMPAEPSAQPNRAALDEHRAWTGL